MHGEFLNIRGTKMSKRFGNYTTPRDLKADGVDAGAVRLLVFQTHYRQKLDLTDDALDGAREGARRLGEFGDRLVRAPVGAGSDAESAAAGTLRSSVTEAMNDDLNAPRAVAALFDFVREANRLLDGARSAGAELRSAWEWAGQVLDVAADPVKVLDLTLVGQEITVEQGSLVGSEAWAIGLANERVEARKARNFKRSDEIRDLLKANGWEIRDTKDGPQVVKLG